MSNHSQKVEDLIAKLQNAKNDNDKFAGCLFVS